jgi:hypothetical protein
MSSGGRAGSKLTRCFVCRAASRLDDAAAVVAATVGHHGRQRRPQGRPGPLSRAPTETGSGLLLTSRLVAGLWWLLLLLFVF